MRRPSLREKGMHWYTLLHQHPVPSKCTPHQIHTSANTSPVSQTHRLTWSTFGSSTHRANGGRFLARRKKRTKLSCRNATFSLYATFSSAPSPQLAKEEQHSMKDQAEITKYLHILTQSPVALQWSSGRMLHFALEVNNSDMLLEHKQEPRQSTEQTTAEQTSSLWQMPGCEP